MSKFHNLLYSQKLQNNLWLTIDEKSSGCYIFRLTQRVVKKNKVYDESLMTCHVSDHEDLTPFEAYVENVWVKEGSTDNLGNKIELRMFDVLFDFLNYTCVYFERNLQLEDTDPTPKVIKWSISGGVAGFSKNGSYNIY